MDPGADILNPLYHLAQKIACERPEPRCVSEFSGRSTLGSKQFPLSLGDHFDGSVGHLDGRLIVDCVRWYG